MTCTHRFNADDVCIDCGYDDGLRYMQPTQHVLRLADLPRPDGEQHDMDPAHDLCLGDDPCICIQLVACEQRVLEAAIAAVREAIGEEWCGEIVPKGEYDCCGCSSYNGIVNDATAAIDALKEKS